MNKLLKLSILITTTLPLVTGCAAAYVPIDPPKTAASVDSFSTYLTTKPPAIPAERFTIRVLMPEPTQRLPQAPPQVITATAKDEDESLIRDVGVGVASNAIYKKIEQKPVIPDVIPETNPEISAREGLVNTTARTAPATGETTMVLEDDTLLAGEALEGGPLLEVIAPVAIVVLGVVGVYELVKHMLPATEEKFPDGQVRFQKVAR